MQTTTLETITPQLAARYLEHNKNRKLQEGYAQRLAGAMERGEWRLTHQGIAFNCDGSLKDGQHRLRAIVICGIPQQFWVTRGVPDDAVLVMDTHKSRSEADAFTLMGVQTEQRVVSMCRSAMFGMGSHGRAVSRDSLFAFMKRHSAAIAFVVDRLANKNRWPFPAAAMSPVLRAYYSADHTRLGEFIRIMCGGTPQGDVDSAANILKNFLMMRRTASSSSGTRGEVYKKCESALKAFLEYRPIAKLYAASVEEFPLPEENE